VTDKIIPGTADPHTRSGRPILFPLGNKVVCMNHYKTHTLSGWHFRSASGCKHDVQCRTMHLDVCLFSKMPSYKSAARGDADGGSQCSGVEGGCGVDWPVGGGAVCLRFMPEVAREGGLRREGRGGSTTNPAAHLTVCTTFKIKKTGASCCCYC
jgi:hypothetical protein